MGDNIEFLGILKAFTFVLVVFNHNLFSIILLVILDMFQQVQGSSGTF